MLKICKKRVHGNGGTTLPWALKKCPRSLYFALLMWIWRMTGTHLMGKIMDSRYGLVTAENKRAPYTNFASRLQTHPISWSI